MAKIKNLTNEIDIMNEKTKTKKVDCTFQEKYDRGLITKEGYDLSALNEKQLTYFRMMYPKSGVLFLTSAPGLAKSAMIRSISKNISKVEIIYKDIKDGKDEDGVKYRKVVDKDLSGKVIASEMFYIDLRLAMLDETDVGLFPDKREMKVTENGEEVLRAFLDHIVPKWAFYSNNPPKKNNGDKMPYCGTIIHFEELNRAPLSVRNAALQILLEREIGFEFQFNSNVIMCATGNLGEEDGTDVEEFDSALNGRLLHLEHKLSYGEWKEYYANDNIQSLILSFLDAHGDCFYVGKASRAQESGNEKAYACPRTWTFLSDYIKLNYGMNAPAQMWIHDIAVIGHAYIGASNVRFLRYVRDIMKISINDIIARYPEFKANNTIFTRDKKSELLQDLRKVDFKQLKPNEIENIKLFMLDMSEDEVSAFLLKILDDDYEFEEDVNLDAEKNQFILGFLRDKRFKSFNNIMLGYVGGSKEPEEKKDFWK
jgi:hypothetical protein